MCVLAFLIQFLFPSFLDRLSVYESRGKREYHMNDLPWTAAIAEINSYLCP